MVESWSTETDGGRMRWLSLALRPQKPYGLLGTGAQGGHLDFRTAPELCVFSSFVVLYVNRNHMAY